MQTLRSKLNNKSIVLFVSVLSILMPVDNVFAESSVWDKSTVNHSGEKTIKVYRSASCKCCGAWIAHLKKHQFNVIEEKTDQMPAIKRKFKVPEKLASCHTAMVGGYVIEGHVPADDIKRLLSEKAQLSGLAVPNMPVGPPGMEMGNKKKDPFAVIKFNNQGSVGAYRQYWAY